MTGTPLTFDMQIAVYVGQANAAWRADQLGPAQDAMDAALRAGVADPGWYDVQRTIEAEAGARAEGRWTWLADELAIEAEPRRWGDAWPDVRRVSRRALTAVTEALDVRWGMPVLLTLVPDDAWMEFMHARYGYYMARTERHKVCLPPSAVVPAGQLARAARHEFAHAAVHQIAGEEVPRWLDEGVAVVMEGGVPDRERRLFSLSLRRRGAPRLDEVSAGFDGIGADLDSPRQRTAYAAAGDFVGRLIVANGMAGVRRMLAGIGHGRATPRAFADAFGTSLRRAEADWRRALGR